MMAYLEIILDAEMALNPEMTFDLITKGTASAFTIRLHHNFHVGYAMNHFSI
jgi:hypothetical protein